MSLDLFILISLINLKDRKLCNFPNNFQGFGTIDNALEEDVFLYKDEMSLD